MILTEVNLGAKCELSGLELKNSPRVIFFGENAEYSFNAISADPETNVSSNLLGQFIFSNINCFLLIKINVTLRSKSPSSLSKPW